MENFVYYRKIFKINLIFYAVPRMLTGKGNNGAFHDTGRQEQIMHEHGHSHN